MNLPPTPAQAQALFASGLLVVEDLPDIAAQWLAEGMDSESLRVLAGATNDDRDDIRDLWMATLQEMNIHAGRKESSWPLIWAYELASWQSGVRSSKEVLRDAVAYLRADDYADQDAEEAWVLWGHWDEMTSNYDPPRTEAEVWADVDKYLHSFS